ncbi:hypothetical protein I3843_13G104100 [Carya illinoinensis]|nr:hypothetical protein I3843_13G104100 [Carya illinoinensis]
MHTANNADHSDHLDSTLQHKLTHAKSTPTHSDLQQLLQQGKAQCTCKQCRPFGPHGQHTCSRNTVAERHSDSQQKEHTSIITLDTTHMQKMQPCSGLTHAHMQKSAESIRTHADHSDVTADSIIQTSKAFPCTHAAAGRAADQLCAAGSFWHVKLRDGRKLKIARCWNSQMNVQQQQSSFWSYFFLSFLFRFKRGQFIYLACCFISRGFGLEEFSRPRTHLSF